MPHLHRDGDGNYLAGMIPTLARSFLIRAMTAATAVDATARLWSGRAMLALRVIADPGTPAAHVIFEQLSDRPMRFHRWADTETAEVAYVGSGKGGATNLSLTCRDGACRLD